jgi:hypothetical protein
MPECLVITVFTSAVAAFLAAFCGIAALEVEESAWETTLRAAMRLMMVCAGLVEHFLCLLGRVGLQDHPRLGQGRWTGTLGVELPSLGGRFLPVVIAETPGQLD